MKRKIFCLAVSLGLIIASCGSPEKMKDAADQIKATCTPAVLQAKAGVINATINVAFPEKYFHPEAVLEMLPVIKYEGGEVTGTVKVLQGEKVKDNNTVIAATGGSYSQEVTFDYKDEMKVATLEIRPTLIDKKGNRLQFPADIKVADGVIATYKLAEVEVVPVSFEDSYQKSTIETKEAQVLFTINRHDVRPAELSKEDVKLLEQFVANALPKEPAKGKGKKAAAPVQDSSKMLKSLEISSYASPDGEMDLNEKLSNNRGSSTDAALAKFFKQAKVRMDNNLVSIKHTAEDWDGFKELMEASDIQDKELVLRVLSMYSDPAVREREIKNISAVYTIIADKILPQLRRSKLLATVEVANLNDEQIKAFVAAGNLDTLDAEQLMYAAVQLYKEDTATQINLYKKVAEKFRDVRGYNNLGAIYLAQDKLDEAKIALDSAVAIKADDAKVKNNVGYMLLKQGKVDEAEKQLAAAGLDQSKAGMAYIAISKGSYDQAVTLLSGSGSVNEGLALLLAGKLDEAKAALDKLSMPKAFYLKAVVGARQNAEADVTGNLDKAGDLKANAKKDAEFVAFWPKL